MQRPPIGETPFLPPVYTCPNGGMGHPDEPCSQCSMIRSPEKTIRMQTLTMKQHSVLSITARHPDTPINQLVRWLKQSEPTLLEGDDVTQVIQFAVIAGELKERGLLARTAISRRRNGVWLWSVTSDGEEYLD